MITPCGNREPTGIHPACSSKAYDSPPFKRWHTTKNVMMGSHLKKKKV